jgi:hypothetical protein
MAPDLVGTSANGVAVSGESQTGEGVRGVSRSGTAGAGVVGEGSTDGSPAGRFHGDVHIDGNVDATHIVGRGNISAKGNVNAAETVNATHVSARGNISAVANVNAADVNVTGTVHTDHIVAQGNISALGNVNATGDVNAQRNLNVGIAPEVTSGLIHVPILAPHGHIVAQGNISAVGNVNAAEVNVSGTVKTRHVSASGNISARGNLNAADIVNTTHVIASGNISALGNVNANNMNVTGDITLDGGDCAEQFDVHPASVEHITPGTVVVIGDGGALRRSSVAYDRCAAGVVSGGGDYRPGIILGRREDCDGRRPAVALIGRVACKVDATYSPIEVGDLLTTSDTPGHAMKATDPARAFGAVIGKALAPVRDGQALVPILVALQ